MLFSDHYGITRTPADDWFDPVLEVDTKLFVDPFLVFQDADPSWMGAHDRIVAHFQDSFELLAVCGCNPHDQRFASAVRSLRFPEPSETCLGYASGSTQGSGSGKDFAKKIATAMCDAIGREVVELRHFEELGILEEGIGPDRISDITTTILKPDLVAYTQSICKRHGVPLVRHRLRAARYDAGRRGFVSEDLFLPTNPKTGGPLLLVPARFLRSLPAINADDWWDDFRASEVRDELNADLGQRLSKREIVKIAKRNPDKVHAWVRAREETKATPYDLVADPEGLYHWASAARSYVRENPFTLNATNHEEFVAVIEKIIERFKHFVEQNGGWKALWHDGEEMTEETAQLLFLGVAQAYCEANGINVDREVELGRGPVDFKFSSGYEARALIEVKKLESGKFWNGLRHQLPSYLASDRSRDGWLLAVRFRDAGVSETRARTLGAEVATVATELDLDLRYGLVDARPKPSASKLTEKDLGEVA